MKRFLTLAVVAALVCAVSSGAVAKGPKGYDRPDRGKGPGANRSLSLERIGTVAGTGAEVISFDAKSERLFVSNAGEGSVDIYDASEPRSPRQVGSVPLREFEGGDTTSVNVGKNGIVAAAIQEDPAQEPGSIVFFTTGGRILSDVEVGAGPDAITFTPDGKKLVVANEGEPLDYCEPGENDPEGAVSVIDVPKDGRVGQDDVATADFRDFDEDDLDEDVRIFGPGASVAQDIEPEYSAISKDSRKAYVTLQENNAIATVDLRKAEVEEINALGFKNHDRRGNGFDASDRDGGINIERWPVEGIYQPDAIAGFETRGDTYLVTANEGDARDYECYAEETRVKDLTPEELPEGIDPSLQADDKLGRLTVTTAEPAREGSGEQGGRLEGLYSYGARSFSILDTDGDLVFDSGDLLEQVTAEEVPELYNSEESNPDEFDQRSDNKGPEPEGVAVGEYKSQKIAFVSNERVGGIVTVDVTRPKDTRFLDYVNEPSDMAPETLDFIPANESPTGMPLVALASEVSQTVSLYELREARKPR